MIAFAANSVLNRMALTGGSIDAMSFGSIRLIAGAVMLAGAQPVAARRAAICAGRGGSPGSRPS